jgi:hypothetical protein
MNCTAKTFPLMCRHEKTLRQGLRIPRVSRYARSATRTFALAGWNVPARRPASSSRLTRTCYATPVGSPWPTRATTHAPCRHISVTGISNTRCATPSWRPIGSRTFGAELPAWPDRSHICPASTGIGNRSQGAAPSGEALGVQPPQIFPRKPSGHLRRWGNCARLIAG